jgi:hypothetical protein
VAGRLILLPFVFPSLIGDKKKSHLQILAIECNTQIPYGGSLVQILLSKN